MYNDLIEAIEEKLSRYNIHRMVDQHVLWAAFNSNTLESRQPSLIPTHRDTLILDSTNESKGPRLNNTYRTSESPAEARQEWMCQLLVSSPYLKIERKKSTYPHRHEKATNIDEGERPMISEDYMVRLIGLANPPRILPGNCARSLPLVVPNHCQPPLGTNISHRVPATSPEGSSVLVKRVPQYPTQVWTHAINLRAQQATKYQLNSGFEGEEVVGEDCWNRRSGRVWSLRVDRWKGGWRTAGWCGTWNCKRIYETKVEKKR